MTFGNATKTQKHSANNDWQSTSWKIGIPKHLFGKWLFEKKIFRKFTFCNFLLCKIIFGKNAFRKLAVRTNIFRNSRRFFFNWKQPYVVEKTIVSWKDPPGCTVKVNPYPWILEKIQNAGLSPFCGKKERSAASFVYVSPRLIASG